jgi:CheY-like chemotaxis protein
MKPLILAVEDNKAMRYLLQTIFSKKYHVVTAADAASAMYWLSKKKFPDVIIASAQLADVDDWELIANLKNSVLYKDIPTVVLSSFENEATEKYCSIYKVTKFFRKPFNPISLVEAIQELTDSKKPIGTTQVKS